MKIGIYGGAFNPVHYGHLRTAQEVLDMLHLDRMVFMPTGRTPFDKPGLEKAAHRYEMVKRAIKGNPDFEVSDMEVRRRGRSYTVDTVKKMKREHRESEMFFILGIDAFLDLPYWKQPDVLMSMAHLVILSRPGYRFDDLASLHYLSQVPGKTLKDLDKGRSALARFHIEGHQDSYLCNVTELNISASHIRGLLNAGKKIKYLLPDSVNSYIISNKLYANTGSRRSIVAGK